MISFYSYFLFSFETALLESVCLYRTSDMHKKKRIQQKPTLKAIFSGEQMQGTTVTSEEEKKLQDREFTIISYSAL